MIEHIPEFYLGPRDKLRVEVTKQGDLDKGILDFGIVTGSEGVQFTGFIAYIK